MRTRIWILCILVIAANFLLLWLRHTAKRETPVQAEATLTNRPEQPQMVEHRQLTNISQLSSNPASVSSLAREASKTNLIETKFLTAWQAPIEFYGKVLDEASNPVAEANIHFRWSEIPARDGMRMADTKSDSEGLFSLNGKRGASLTISFGKRGYYSSGRGEQTFLYALPKAIS